MSAFKYKKILVCRWGGSLFKFWCKLVIIIKKALWTSTNSVDVKYLVIKLDVAPHVDHYVRYGNSHIIVNKQQENIIPCMYNVFNILNKIYSF